MLASKQLTTTPTHTTTRHDPDTTARLRAAIGQLSRRLRRTAAAASLTPTETSVLLSVARLGPLRLSELAELEGLNATLLSRVVGSLSEQGLLTREADPDDRRSATVCVTARGRRLRERIHRERNETLSRHLEALSPADRDALTRAIPALEALADELRADAPPGRRPRPEAPVR